MYSIWLQYVFQQYGCRRLDDVHLEWKFTWLSDCFSNLLFASCILALKWNLSSYIVSYVKLHFWYIGKIAFLTTNCYTRNHAAHLIYTTQYITVSIHTRCAQTCLVFMYSATNALLWLSDLLEHNTFTLLPLHLPHSEKTLIFLACQHRLCLWLDRKKMF